MLESILKGETSKLWFWCLSLSALQLQGRWSGRWTMDACNINYWVAKWPLVCFPHSLYLSRSFISDIPVKWEFYDCRTEPENEKLVRIFPFRRANSHIDADKMWSERKNVGKIKCVVIYEAWPTICVRTTNNNFVFFSVPSLSFCSHFVAIHLEQNSFLSFMCARSHVHRHTRASFYNQKSYKFVFSLLFSYEIF